MTRKYKYALITGASSGIGAEFARQLAEEGYSPILVARRKERLVELGKEIEHEFSVDCTILTADLSYMSECARVFEYIEKLPVGIIINNAGFGDCGAFVDGNLEKELSMIDVNVKAMHYITKLALRKFRMQKGGYLLNVASSAGLYPDGPYMATYYATKSYVVSLTRAIATELNELGFSRIHISALCPGPVDTEFNEVADVEFALKGITPQYCVSEAIRGMKQQKLIIVPSLVMKLGVIGSRFLPERLLSKIVGHQQKKKMLTP